jgi:hypothetical protein
MGEKMTVNTEIQLNLPASIRDIWNKLVARGIYISAENERELYNDILRYEDDIKKFLMIFDQRLVVHSRDFVYAENISSKRLIRGAEQLMVFLTVFFEKFQKIYTSPQNPWYNQLAIEMLSLGSINLFSTETFERRLLSVGLHDEFDIFEKVLKPAATQFLVHIPAVDIYSVSTPEEAANVEFKFNSPIYRFVDIFTNIAFNSEENIISELPKDFSDNKNIIPNDKLYSSSSTDEGGNIDEI